jgi:hypothetical protein
MSKLSECQEKIEIELNYFVGKQDTKNGIFVGGVKNPKYLDELEINIFEDEIFNEELDSFVKNGKIQVSLSGSSRSLEELGKYLIALSRYNTEDPDYHDHFDNIKNSEGSEMVNLIVKKRK